MSDDLIIEVNGQKVQGWEKIRVTRSIERTPADFEITMTERYPGELEPMIINAGDPCKVYLGADLVITGYVDRVGSLLTGTTHEVTVIGRSKSADLLDCSAEWPGSQIMGSSVVDIARKLCKPYGINVINRSANNGPVIPQFTLILGETVFSIIERMSSYSRFLVYDDTDGNLLIDRVNTTDQAASGFEEGVNVESARITRTMDNRYSQYVAFKISIDNFNDFSQTLALGDSNQLAITYDKGVPRYRRLVMIAEPVSGGRDLVVARALWESARRLGRSQSVHIRTDGWRDKAGKLYTPNTLAKVHIPTMKVVNEMLTISQVVYERDETGTHADVSLMPSVAFTPEPTLLYRFGLGEIQGGNQLVSAS